jgi:hypothetical protein
MQTSMEPAIPHATELKDSVVAVNAGHAKVWGKEIRDTQVSRRRNSDLLTTTLRPMLYMHACIVLRMNPML